MTDEWWQTDPAYVKGIEIATDQKRGGDVYREVVSLQCRNCVRQRRQARTILAVYVGPGGQQWLWTTGYRGPANVEDDPGQGPVPVSALPPHARSLFVGIVAVANCPRCDHGQPFVVRRNGIDATFRPHPGERARVVD